MAGRKIIKSFSHKSPLTNRVTKYLVIKVIGEPTEVRGLRFKADHIYYVLPGNEDNPNKYLIPFDNPNLDTEYDFNYYRRAMGLMMPEQIKKLRKSYGLSQRELGVVLGLSYSTISDIENNHLIQSVSQDTTLRTLLSPRLMADLIRDRKPIINNQHSPHINNRKLNNKANLINELLGTKVPSF